MKVQFTTTTKAKLGTLAITNGQIIALSDAVGYYYDMGNVRYPASSMTVTDELPVSGIDNMMYILQTAAGASMYMWDSTASTYVRISGSDVEIDDTTASTASVYSSSKTETVATAAAAALIDDTSASTATVYSSSKTEEVAGAAALALIDDATASTASVYSSSKVDTLIQGITSFEVEIVQALPTEDIDPHKIYFLEKSTPSSDNIYEEYMYIENAWELIGTTEVSVSIATTATAGIVKPDGTTISVAADGTITAIGGGSSGHIIMTDGGSTVSAEDNLQFKGAYVADDSTNDKTVVNVVRDMSYSDVANLSTAEKVGIIITERDRHPQVAPLSSDYISYSNTTSGLASTTVQGAIDELADGGGGGGGHQIMNSLGSTVTQEDVLQFVDSGVTDDSTNGRTKVEIIQKITSAQLATAPDGIYDVIDEAETYLNASQIGYSNSTSGLASTVVQSAIDEVDNKYGTWASTTIAAGSTAVTISDAAISTASFIDVYFKDAIMAPTNMSVVAGAVTIEIDALESNQDVAVRILNL